MRKGTIQIGSKFVNTKGRWFTVIRKESQLYYTVLFDSGAKTTAHHSNIKAGNVKDVLHKDIRGVACIGQGEHTDTKTKSYARWQAMLKRCYSTEGKKSFYEDVKVCEEWLNYQNYAKWFIENYVEGWEVDKDLLGDGKVYSPSTCCFLPDYINIMLRDVNNTNTDGIQTIYNKHSIKYKARVNMGKVRKTLGTFDKYADALEARTEYKIAHVISTVDESPLDKTLADKIKNVVIDKIKKQQDTKII